MSLWCVSGVVCWPWQRVTRPTSNSRRTHTLTHVTVCIPLSTTLQLWRWTSLRGRTRVTCHTLWRHSCDDGRRFEDGLASRVVRFEDGLASRVILCDVTAVTMDVASRTDSRHVSYSVTSSLSGTTPPSPVTVRDFTFIIIQRATLHYTDL